jgi:hypothetical protein
MLGEHGKRQQPGGMMMTARNGTSTTSCFASPCRPGSRQVAMAKAETYSTAAAAIGQEERGN